MINLVTGRTGSTHVTSGQFRDMIRGMVGPDEYFGIDGSRMEITKVSNTVFAVGSGTAYKNGCVFNIPYGSFENVTIDTETSGYERTDAVVIRWNVDVDGIETAELNVVKGIPTNGSASAPTVLNANIQEGSTTADMLIGYVHIAKDGAAQVQMPNKKIPGLDLLHPVGSYHITTDDRNPSLYFGGEWERITDRTIMGAGNKYSLGWTGGRDSVTLTDRNIPDHVHPFRTLASSTTKGNIPYDAGGFNVVLSTGNILSGTEHETKSAAAIDITPPYVAAYIWKRVG